MPALSVAALSGTLAVSPPGGAGEEREYRAVRAVDRIVVDGRRTEKTWDLAPADARFVEREPELGGAPAVRTSVRVAYDDFALYVFVEAQSRSGEIRVRTLQRDDVGILADDSVHVKIDPTHNHRNGYAFVVNAEGVQFDELGLDDGAVFVPAWDAVWRAEVERREDGYSVEFEIPFAILGIKQAREQTLGFDVSRVRPSDNATDDWRLIVPPRSSLAASQYGDLTGLRHVDARRMLEYMPYALARTDFERTFTLDPGLRPTLAVGGDVRMQLGSRSFVEASLLTDFAQVEADEIQVNRDRFPLFFPERRPFFLNGLDIFDFGLPKESQLFFSRQVGLSGGVPLTLLGGAKVYGRSGPVSYGVLVARTLGRPRRASSPDPPIPADSVAVGRTRVQITPAFNLGVLALGRTRAGTAESNHAAGGIDGQLLSRDGQWRWYSFVAGTYNRRPAAPAPASPRSPRDEPVDPYLLGGSAASTLEARWLYVRPRLSWSWSDRRFDPALGFYRRTGSSKQVAALRFVPRPRHLALQQVMFGPEASVETDAEYSRLLRHDWRSFAKLTWRNGAEALYGVGHVTDWVQEPFVLYGHEIEARRYRGFVHRAEASLPTRRAIAGELGYELIEAFGGRIHQPSVDLVARLGQHLTLRGAYTHRVGHFGGPDRRFGFGFANGNLDVAFTRNLALENQLRLNLSPDQPSVGVLSRFRWRFAPGSDLFVVYRNDIPLEGGAEDPPLPPFHELTLKVAFYLRALLGRERQR